jgi:hypothetical protein
VALSADGDTALVGGPTANSDTGAAWIFNDVAIVIPPHVGSGTPIGPKTQLKLYNANSYAIKVMAQLTVSDAAVIARAKSRKPYVIGSGHLTLAAHETGKLKLKLLSRVQRYLDKHHKLKATLTLTTTAPGHASATVTTHVKLRD